jgi:hypothetical protein
VFDGKSGVTHPSLAPDGLGSKGDTLSLENHVELADHAPEPLLGPDIRCVLVFVRVEEPEGQVHTGKELLPTLEKYSDQFTVHEWYSFRNGSTSRNKS